MNLQHTYDSKMTQGRLSKTFNNLESFTRLSHELFHSSVLQDPKRSVKTKTQTCLTNSTLCCKNRREMLLRLIRFTCIHVS